MSRPSHYQTKEFKRFREEYAIGSICIVLLSHTWTMDTGYEQKLFTPSTKETPWKCTEHKECTMFHFDTIDLDLYFVKIEDAKIDCEENQHEQAVLFCNCNLTMTYNRGMTEEINFAQKVSVHLQIVGYIRKPKYYVKMECIHEKRSFLLRILTPLPLPCYVVWLSYGYSNGLRSNFESCKSPYSIQIQYLHMHHRRQYRN